MKLRIFALFVASASPYPFATTTSASSQEKNAWNANPRDLEGDTREGLLPPTLQYGGMTMSGGKPVHMWRLAPRYSLAARTHLAFPSPATKPAPLTPPRAITHGLSNLGATCFLNSFFKHVAYDATFYGALAKTLEPHPGEGTALHQARLRLQGALRTIMYNLATSDSEGLAMRRLRQVPSKWVLDFIAAWNHLYLVEKESSLKLTGIDFTLSPDKQEDVTFVLPVIHLALAYPKLKLREEYTALDSLSQKPRLGLAPKQRSNENQSYLSLTLGMRDEGAHTSLQALIDRTWGGELLSGVRMWEDEGVATTETRKLTQLAATTKDLTLVIEDRVFQNYEPTPSSRPWALRKNRTRLEINTLLSVPVFDRVGKSQRKNMRLRSVVVHSGGGTYGHYTLMSYELNRHGQLCWVNHDDSQVLAGFYSDSMAQGARVLHYEEAPAE